MQGQNLNEPVALTALRDYRYYHLVTNPPTPQHEIQLFASSPASPFSNYFRFSLNASASASSFYDFVVERNTPSLPPSHAHIHLSTWNVMMAVLLSVTSEVGTRKETIYNGTNLSTMKRIIQIWETGSGEFESKEMHAKWIRIGGKWRKQQHRNNSTHKLKLGDIIRAKNTKKPPK